MAERTPLTETSQVAGTVERALDDSRVVRTLRAPFREGSRSMRAAHWTADAVTNSFVFRWLTAEPEPDVVVVDLRETWTVGPFIALLDWLVPHGLRMWHGSTSKRAVERTATAFRDAPVQLVSVVVLAALFVTLVLTWGSVSTASLAVRLFVAALALVGLRVTWTWEELVESRAGELAAALFAPPEPPEDER